MKTLVTCLLSAAALALSATPVKLAENGKTDSTIRPPENPTPMELLAVKELQTYLKKSTGADFRQGDSSKRIVLRRDSSLAPQESSVKLEGDSLILGGGDEWGVLYAVYSFLENQLGIRWFSAYGDELVPEHKNLNLDFQPYKQKPSYEKRALIGSSYYKFPASSMFFLRNRLNICNTLENKAYPGSKSLLPLRGSQCHTLFFYIPPKKGHYPQAMKFKEEKYYFEEHPEYFGMDNSGKRVLRLQLCFSNPDLRREFTRRFLECVELMGTDGVYSIGAMDWPGTFCYCPECKKLEEKYQCHAGPMLDYMIELSGIVTKKYPKLYLSTLAYRKNQSEKPPVMKEKLPKNIIIIFAPIDDDFSKTLTHKNNAETYRHLKGWAKVAENLWMWYYPLTYGGEAVPFGGIRRSAEDTRLLREGGANGTFYEHDVGVFSGMNFGDLMTWMFLKLFQNPEADYRALVKEFCSFYYGAAAPEMAEYIRELDEATMAVPAFVMWCSGTPKTVLSPENLVRWTKLFDAMEKKTASDPMSLTRVREARMGLDIAVLQNDFRELVRKNPGLFPSVREMEKRILATLDASLQRRVPDGPMQYLRATWKKGVLTALENAVIVASITPKPLGAPLDNADPAKVRQVFAKQVNKCGFAKLPDAAVGQAIYDPKAGVELPFTCGFYDSIGKRFLLNRKITRDEIVPDRFHLYKLGEAPISSACYLWTMGSWIAGFNLGSLYTAGEAPDKKYEIWVSMKFEGPGYHPASKAKENRVWLDRAVVVEKE